MIRKSLRIAIVSLLVFSSCGGGKDPWKLAWMDDFDGPELDTAAWTRVPRGPHDWNNTMSLWEDLVRFEDGQIVLRGIVNPDTLADPSRIVTAGITTAGKRSFRRARFEVRARFSSARGFWPALWLMPQRDSATAQGDYAEIDIMEHLNADTLVYQTVHSAYSLNGHDETPPHYTTAGIDPSDWIVYAAEVHPDSVCFYVNGIRTLTYPRIVNDIDPERDQFPFADLPFYFILSNQVGGGWVGPVAEEDLPTELRIDWVKVWVPAEEAEPAPDRHRFKAVMEVAGRQGVACDGAYYYVSGSTALYKYAMDGTLVLANEEPFEAITAGSPSPNHIGDIDIYDGEIYAGCEYFLDGVGTNIQTAVYDSETLQYKRSIPWEPASGQVECCGLAVDRARGLVWMADWVDGSHLYCYDRESGDYLGKVALDPAPALQQGIFCLDDGRILISSDDGDADRDEPDHLYACYPYQGEGQALVDKAPVSLYLTTDAFCRAGEIEGLCVNPASGDLVVLSNRGARIVLGMPKGFYDGYDREIHELYVFR